MRSQKMKESPIEALQQASRDTLLNLRKEIQTLPHNIISVHVKEHLSSEHLGHIIESVIKNYLSHSSEKADVTVSLSQHDGKVLKEGCIEKLQDQLKHPVKFYAHEGIGKGWQIFF